MRAVIDVGQALMLCFGFASLLEGGQQTGQQDRQRRCTEQAYTRDKQHAHGLTCLHRADGNRVLVVALPAARFALLVPPLGRVLGRCLGLQRPGTCARNIIIAQSANLPRVTHYMPMV